MSCCGSTGRRYLLERRLAAPRMRAVLARNRLQHAQQCCGTQLRDAEAHPCLRVLRRTAAESLCSWQVSKHFPQQPPALSLSHVGSSPLWAYTARDTKVTLLLLWEFLWMKCYYPCPFDLRPGPDRVGPPWGSLRSATFRAVFVCSSPGASRPESELVEYTLFFRLDAR